MSQTAVQMVEAAFEDETDGTEQILYLISHPHGYIKIGVSSNPIRRLSELQSGSPYELDIIGFAGFSDPEQAEKALHSEFESHRVRGEWFELHHDTIGQLVEDNGELLTEIVRESDHYQPQTGENDE